MPYCTKCGSEVAANSAFCGKCGLRQPRPEPSVVPGPFENISPRTASILCYIPIFGVIPAIIILASKHFRSNGAVRFDAFQSVYLFVAWLIVSSALPILLLTTPGFGLEHAMLGMIKLAFLICWIVLLVKAAKNEQLYLPIIGDLAHRSTTEQL